MFRRLGQFTVRHPWLTCSVWLALAAILTAVAPDWQQHSLDDDIRFLPRHFSVSRGYELLAEAFPKDLFASRVLLALERPESPLTEGDYRLVDEIVAEVKQLAQEEAALKITHVASYREPMIGPRFTSADRHCTLIQISLATPYLALQTQTTVDRIEALVRPLVEEGAASGLHLFVTGPAALGRDLVRATARSLEQTTWATIALVIVILLLVYRSPLLALIPLTTIGVATWVALQVLALIALIPGVHLVNVSQVFTIVILFGAGTDYCLFLISRYREELEAGAPIGIGLTRAVEQVGGAISASAGTVMVGLGMMVWAEFGKIRHAGPVIAVALVIGLAASLTLTPALLSLAQEWAFWPRRLRIGTPRPESRTLWERLSRLVARRPILTWSVSLVVLLPLALIGSQIAPTFKPTGDLGPYSPSVQGLEMIQRRFPPGETGPITILLVAPNEFQSLHGRETIESLSRGLGYIENVAEVRSLTQPLGKPLPKFDDRATVSSRHRLSEALGHLRREMNDLLSRSLQRANDVYLSRIRRGEQIQYVARIDVVLSTDPFAPTSIHTLGTIEAFLRMQVPADWEWEFYGVTVHTRDMAELIAQDQQRVNLLVVAGVLLILLVVVRSIWLALYLLGTVMLSYYAALGATALLAMVWAGRPLGEIEWRVPFFLFTILIAVGEDYNILMVSRALQERRRYGPIEGLRRGLARTGGTITACGIIMAGTFATLMLGDLWTLTQIGFALSVGVLMDTMIVRPFLVPAMLLLVWRDAAPQPTHLRPLSRSIGEADATQDRPARSISHRTRGGCIPSSGDERRLRLGS